MNQDDLYEFLFRNRKFKMFNEIIEITEITLTCKLVVASNKYIVTLRLHS